MLVQKGIKFRAYPTKEQQNLINRTFGCCRFIYNRALDMRINAYKNGEKAGYNQTSSMLTAMKRVEDFAFLCEVDSIALQQALRDLNTAFKNFFEQRAGYPRFKSKHNHWQSYRTINQHNKIRIVDNYIKLPKVGYVKIKRSISDIGEINSATVKRSPSGKYYITLNVDFEPIQTTASNEAIGVDVGIKEFYTTSNGDKFDNPKHLEHAQKRLAREQRKLSRRTKGSRNYKKQRIKVARVHERVVNQRNDFLQQKSTKLIRENQTICIEDLNIKGMLRNRCLSKAISSVSWSKFFDMLEYKAKWYGRTIVWIPTFYPSSQTCSCCGYKNPLVKDLKVREWVCPQCHTVHDRDINAGINILNKGFAMLASYA